MQTIVANSNYTAVTNKIKITEERKTGQIHHVTQTQRHSYYLSTFCDSNTILTVMPLPGLLYTED